MPTVNIYEAKTHFSKLVDTAASGTDVIIARNGKPVVRITTLDENGPGQQKRQRYRLGLLEGEDSWIADDFDAPLPPEILAEFEGE